MNPEGIERLSVAIVILAMQDYLGALRTLQRHEKDETRRYWCNHAKNTVIQCELFFRRDCKNFIDVDGEKIMEILREKSFDPSYRIEYGGLNVCS